MAFRIIFHTCTSCTLFMTGSLLNSPSLLKNCNALQTVPEIKKLCYSDTKNG